jgi:acrylyl-CoA reductase (NADPH)
MSTFRALLVSEANAAAAPAELTREQLPAGDTLIRVEYSSLNYKDGLALTGKPGVIRSYPMVPGIDLCGVVEESAGFAAGTRVVVTGNGLSESHWGGYAQYARVPAGFCVALPPAFTAVQAMAIGTAGFTAMQCVLALEAHGVKPGGKPVVVTGAAGGVGSVAVALLAKLGHAVTASTGRAETHNYLRSLGATEIVDRAVLGAAAKKPLEAERWAGAVDSVGGDTLAGVLRTVAYGGCVAACGLAGGAGLTTTVLPFILRGVTLAGIDSVRAPLTERQRVWTRLSSDLATTLLDAMTEVHPLSNALELGGQILAGQVRGRVVLDVNR